MNIGRPTYFAKVGSRNLIFVQTYNFGKGSVLELVIILFLIRLIFDKKMPLKTIFDRFCNHSWIILQAFGFLSDVNLNTVKS